MEGSPTAVPRPIRLPSFKFRLNHTDRTLHASGFIRNIDDGVGRDAFRIAIGITVVKGGVAISSQQIFNIDPPIMAGEELETPGMKGPLVYLDEDAGARYRFEMLVDLDNDVGERTSTNNYALLPDWYFLSPGSRDTGAFVLDTSPTE